MTGLAQNEMKAKRGMPLLVRSMEGLGVAFSSMLRHLQFARVGYAYGLRFDRRYATAV